MILLKRKTKNYSTVATQLLSVIISKFHQTIYNQHTRIVEQYQARIITGS